MSESKVTISFDVGPGLNNLVQLALSTILRVCGVSETKPPEPETSVASEHDSAAPTFNGLMCSVCGADQFETASGVTCINGHGGADGVKPDDTPAINEIPNENTQIPSPNGNGPELADGIPWDHRIHSSSKKTYAKAPNGWKLKRGVDPTLVETVTAELRAAMAIPAGGAPADTPPPPPETTPTDPETAFGLEQTPTPPPPETNTAAAPEIITTFAQLVTAITGAGLQNDPKVQTALDNVGLASLQLLGARPDLVPAVAAELFPGV